MQKILPISDMHSEFITWRWAKYGAEADLVIAAGDIGTKATGPSYLRSVFGDREVVYVAGNHEYYGSSIQSMDEMLREECRKYGIHFLQCDAVEIEGIKIVGCTLWSDFELFGPDNVNRAIKEAERYMDDYRSIYHEDKKKGALGPAQTIEIHRNHLAWLRCQQADIVVTHHCPSYEGVLDCYKNSLLSAAFVSDLDHVVLKSEAKYWICGHSHVAKRFWLSGTEVIMNCMGYPEEQVEGFDPGLILEI